MGCGGDCSCGPHKGHCGWNDYGGRAFAKTRRLCPSHQVPVQACTLVGGATEPAAGTTFNVQSFRHLGRLAPFLDGTATELLVHFDGLPGASPFALGLTLHCAATESLTRGDGLLQWPKALQPLYAALLAPQIPATANTKLGPPPPTRLAFLLVWIVSPADLQFAGPLCATARDAAGLKQLPSSPDRRRTGQGYSRPEWSRGRDFAS